VTKKRALCTSSVAYQGGRKPQFQINYDLVVRAAPKLLCSASPAGHTCRAQASNAQCSALVCGLLRVPLDLPSAQSTLFLVCTLTTSLGGGTAALDPLSVRQVGARAGAGGGRGGAVGHLWRARRVRLLLLHEGEPCLGYNMGMG